MNVVTYIQVNDENVEECQSGSGGNEAGNRGTEKMRYSWALP